MTDPQTFAPAAAADVLAATALAFGVAERDLTCPGRARRVTAARHAAALVLRLRPKPDGSQRSLAEIGTLLGGRSRASIRDAIAAAEARALHNPAVAERQARLLGSDLQTVNALLLGRSSRASAGASAPPPLDRHDRVAEWIRTRGPRALPIEGEAMLGIVRGSMLLGDVLRQARPLARSAAA